jgi:hypothetical protein
VTAASPGYKVVFNPDRTDLLIGPKSLWRDHRPGIAPTVVFRKAYRYADLPLRGPVEFQVPEAPPGRYLVSVYDGSEGGVHYTWETFRVTEPAQAIAGHAPAPSSLRTSAAAGVSVLAAVLVGASALLVGLLLGGLAAGRRRRRAPPPRDDA